jgi:Regulated-SNARE-like domain
MIKSTQIARLDGQRVTSPAEEERFMLTLIPGLNLCASVDDSEDEATLSEVKSQVKQVLRKLTRNSEPQASIESGQYNIKSVPHSLFIQSSKQQDANDQTPSYLIENDIVFICITDRSYPRKLAFTYLADLSREFGTTYPPQQVLSPTLRPYAFMEFDTFISRTRATYADSRASRRAARRHESHDQEHRGPALPRRQPRSHGRDQLPAARRQQEVPARRRAHQLGVDAQAIRPFCRIVLHHPCVYMVALFLRKGGSCCVGTGHVPSQLHVICIQNVAKIPSRSLELRMVIWTVMPTIFTPYDTIKYFEKFPRILYGHFMLVTRAHKMTPPSPSLYL